MIFSYTFKTPDRDSVSLYQLLYWQFKSSGLNRAQTPWSHLDPAGQGGRPSLGFMLSEPQGGGGGGGGGGGVRDLRPLRAFVLEV